MQNQEFNVLIISHLQQKIPANFARLSNQPHLF